MTIALDEYVTDDFSLDSEITWAASGNTDLTVDITDRVATITAPGGWTGSETITFTATDENGLGLSGSDSADFSVGDLVDFQLTKVVDNPTPNEGNTVTYTVTLTNDNITDGTGVAVTDALPSGVTYSSSSATAGTYDELTDLDGWHSQW